MFPVKTAKTYRKINQQSPVRTAHVSVCMYVTATEW